MSNTVLTNKEAGGIIAGLAAGMFKDKAQFLTTVDIEPDKTFEGKAEGYSAGDTVTITKPARFTMGTGADVTSSIQDVIEEKVTLSLNKQRNVAIACTSAEIKTDIAIKSWAKRILEPAITTLVNGIEAECLVLAKDGVANSVGVPGANTFDQITMLQAAEKINKYLAPGDSERYALLDSSAMTLATTARAGQFIKAADDIYRKGYVGEADGFKYIRNELLPTHTNGNDVTGVTVRTTVSTAGSTTLAVQGLTANTGTVKKGSTFTVASVYAVNPVTGVAYDFLQKFVVTADVTADASGYADLTVSPAMYASGSRKSVSAFPQSSAAMVFDGVESQASMNSLVYHKSAFRFISAPLIVPEGKHLADQRRADGISIRVIQDHDTLTDKVIMRLDALYGFVPVRPEWAARLPK